MKFSKERREFSHTYSSLPLCALCAAEPVTRLADVLYVADVFNVCHPEVFNTYINTQWRISQTQQNFIMFIIVLGQYV